MGDEDHLRHRTAMAASARGTELSRSGRWLDALAAFEDAVAGFRELQTERPGQEHHYEVLLAGDLNNRGVCLWRLDRLEEAVPPLTEAAATLRRLDQDGAWRTWLAATLQTLSEVLSGLGRFDEAVEASADAVQLRRADHSADRRTPTAPASTDADLASALRVFVEVRVAAGRDLGAAQAALSETVRALTRLLPSDPRRFVPEMYATQELHARLLDRLGRHEDAAEVRAWLQSRPLDAAGGVGLDPRQAAGAQVAEAVRLTRRGHDEDAIAVVDRLLGRYGAYARADVRETVASALVTRGIALRHLGRREEEIATYDDVDRRFGDEPSPAVRAQVARSLVAKGVALAALRRIDEEVDVLDEVTDRYAADVTPATRIQAAKAMLAKAGSLRRAGRTSEAVVAADELVARFAGDGTPAIERQVERAQALRRDAGAA